MVLDVDKPTDPADPLFACASHVIFSAEALRLTTNVLGCDAALARAAEFCHGLVAVTDEAEGVRWRDRTAAVRHVPAFAVAAADTLATGDVFHGAFALALVEGRDEAEGLHFASAAAALKCTRFGGIAGTPDRAAVEQLFAVGRRPISAWAARSAMRRHRGRRIDAEAARAAPRCHSSHMVV